MAISQGNPTFDRPGKRRLPALLHKNEDFIMYKTRFSNFLA